MGAESPSGISVRVTTVAHNRRPTAEEAPSPNLFGHRRLTIIDLSDAALQPMSTYNEEYLLVFNGTSTTSPREAEHKVRQITLKRLSETWGPLSK